MSLKVIFPLFLLIPLLSCKSRPQSSLEGKGVNPSADGQHWNTPRQLEALKVWRNQKAFLTVISQQMEEPYTCGDKELDQQLTAMQLSNLGYRIVTGQYAMYYQVFPDFSFRVIDIFRAHEAHGLIDKAVVDRLDQAFASHFAKQAFWDFEPRLIKYNLRTFSGVAYTSDSDGVEELKGLARKTSWELGGPARELAIKCFESKTGKKVPLETELSAEKNRYDSFDKKVHATNKNATPENTPNLVALKRELDEQYRIKQDFEDKFMHLRELQLGAFVNTGYPRLEVAMSCPAGRGKLLSDFGNADRCPENEDNKKAYREIVNFALKSAGFEDESTAGPKLNLPECDPEPRQGFVNIHNLQPGFLCMNPDSATCMQANSKGDLAYIKCPVPSR